MFADNIDTIWETSRHNSWSFALPLILNVGTAILILIAFVRPIWLRWTLNLLSVLSMSYFAIEYSSLEIEEKWRIRRDWIAENQDTLTEQDRVAATVDGANRVLGPILSGGYAAMVRGGLVLVGLAVIRFVLIRIRRVISPKPHSQSTSPRIVADCIADAENPYAPPN